MSYFFVVVLTLLSAPVFAKPIEITLSSKGNDIAFDQKAVQVPFGESIEISFKNEAAKDSEILHNIAILKPGAYNRVMKAFQDSDYDMEKITKHPDLVAITPTLPPGKSSLLRLSKDKIKKPGYYTYVCLIPGHADMLGMKGTLYVQEKS